MFLLRMALQGVLAAVSAAQGSGARGARYDGDSGDGDEDEDGARERHDGADAASPPPLHPAAEPPADGLDRLSALPPDVKARRHSAQGVRHVRDALPTPCTP
jgi:hypothetical protein